MLLTPDFRVDPTILGQQGRGREGDLPQREGKGGGEGWGGQGGECRDEWMDGVTDGSRYSHLRRSCQCECDHGYYYSLHDEMAKSADAECSHPLL